MPGRAQAGARRIRRPPPRRAGAGRAAASPQIEERGDVDQQGRGRAGRGDREGAAKERPDHEGGREGDVDGGVGMLVRPALRRSPSSIRGALGARGGRACVRNSAFAASAAVPSRATRSSIAGQPEVREQHRDRAVTTASNRYRARSARALRGGLHARDDHAARRTQAAPGRRSGPRRRRRRCGCGRTPRAPARSCRPTCRDLLTV